MVRIIISIALLVALCVLVVLNLDYKSSVNLFWVVFDNVSIVAVGLVSFVAGVLYSFFLYATRYFIGLKRSSMAARTQELARREQEVVAKEDEVAQAAAQIPEGTVEAGDVAAPRKKKRRLRR